MSERRIKRSERMGAAKLYFFFKLKLTEKAVNEAMLGDAGAGEDDDSSK